MDGIGNSSREDSVHPDSLANLDVKSTIIQSAPVTMGLRCRVSMVRHVSHMTSTTFRSKNICMRISLSPFYQLDCRDVPQFLVRIERA